MLEERNRLIQDFGVDLIAKIRDGLMTGILDLGDAKVLRDSLGHEENYQSDTEDGPDVVEPWGKELVEVQHAAAGKSKERQLRSGGRWGEHKVEGQAGHEGHHAFSQSHKGQQNDAEKQADTVGLYVGQQAFQLRREKRRHTHLRNWRKSCL